MPRLRKIAVRFNYQDVFGQRYEHLDNHDVLHDAAEEVAKHHEMFPLAVGGLEVGRVVEHQIDRAAEQIVFYVVWDDKVQVAQVIG